MAQFSMITDYGLQQMTTARPGGPYIEIAYWVPVYDYRIDPNLGVSDPQYSNTDITTVTTSADMVPSGEVYWNLQDWDADEYRVVGDDGNSYLVSGGTIQDVGSDTVVTDFLHRNSAKPVVYYDGASEIKTVGDSYLYGSNVATPGTSGTEWTFYGGAQESIVTSATNPVDPTEPPSASLYRGVTYISVIQDCDNAYDCRRANFEITISVPAGSIKFNKVGLYAVIRSEAGDITTGPFLFGQVILPEPQVIISDTVSSTTGATVSSLILDYQLDFSAVNTDFDDIFYGSPGEYWSRVTNASGQYGLLYEGSVFITNTLGVEDQNATITPNPDDVGVAKTLMATYHTVNKPNPAEERLLPQLCLQYVDHPADPIGTFDNGNQFSYRIRSTFRVNENGNLELDMYGGCNNEGYYSFMPKTDSILSLGKPSNRWRSLYLGTSQELNFGDYVLDSNGVVENDPLWNHITNGSGYIVFKENNMSNESYGLGHFGNSSIEVGPHYDSRDYPIQSVKSNYFYTYGNISNYMPLVNNGVNSTIPVYDLGVRSTSDIVLYNISTDSISSNEFGHDIGADGKEYDAISTINSIWDMIYAGQRGDNVLNNVFVQGVVQNTIFKRFYDDSDWISKTNSGGDLRTLSDIRRSIFGQDVIIDINTSGDGIDKDVLLTSSRYIFTNGDILPMVDGLNNLGSYGNGYRELHIRELIGDWQENDSTTVPRHILFNGNVYPSSSGLVIGKNPTTNFKWGEINSINLGNSDDYIDNGYITTINTNMLKANESYINTLHSWNINSKYKYDESNPPTNPVKEAPNINLGFINNIPISEYLKGVDVITKIFTYEDLSGKVEIDNTNVLSTDYPSKVHFNPTVTVTMNNTEIISCVLVYNKGEILATTIKTWTGTGGYLKLFELKDGVKGLLSMMGISNDIINGSTFINNTSSFTVNTTDNNINALSGQLQYDKMNDAIMSGLSWKGHWTKGKNITNNTATIRII